MRHSPPGELPAKGRLGQEAPELLCELPPSNQGAQERRLGGSRQKAIIKVKSILYTLPSTKGASVFICCNPNASVYLNIYLNQPSACFKEATMKR